MEFGSYLLLNIFSNRSFTDSKHIKDSVFASCMPRLRKPVIEKMRRDRINSSIEQLRILLEKEFQKQQLPSKPEKADILEMTVSFLQQHLAAKSAPSPSLSYREGHSRCLQESLHFLSLQPQSEARVNLLHHIQGPHCACTSTRAVSL
ncbi:transcription factor HES-5-like [Bombina bombina]|uniref:transcription factor HES-5-like n=1 Tax=Bombina bombina TaxID=8345 RepID=UPI00235AF385|nr:transcription factor HES-5-like [Bombina bombina]